MRMDKEVILTGKSQVIKSTGNKVNTTCLLKINVEFNSLLNLLHLH